MKLRHKVLAATVLVFAAAGTKPATHAVTSHAVASHPRGGGTVLAVTSGGMPANEQLANQMAAALGWDSAQQACLDKLWAEESAGTWSATVTNPTSGAYGIPQSLPPGKMADPAQGGGPGWQTDPGTQIRWGLHYMDGRYGSPCGAWQFETSHVPNWY